MTRKSTWSFVDPSIGLASVGVLFASLCFGLVPVFSRGLTESGMAPHAVAFYRYVTAAVLLLPLLYLHRQHWPAILWGGAVGIVMGLGWVGYVFALQTAPVSTVGVMYMTYPVFTLIMAWVLFADRPSRRAIVAALIIVLAAVLAGSPAAVPVDQLPALAISLAAPLGFGFGICVLVHRLTIIPPLVRIASVSLGSVIGLLPLVLTSPAGEVWPQALPDWYLVIGIGVMTAFIPQLIYTICAPVIGTSRTAIMGAIELPTMFLVGVLVFGEHLTILQMVACALVVGAIGFSGSRVTKNVSTNLTK